MPIARVNRVKLNYLRVGEGPDVVMIHGLAANMAFWNLSIISALSRDFRVTLYDLRGHGKSQMPARGYSPARMALDLRALMDHLGIAQAHLVGHSFGGSVALHFAARHPQRALSLTLADTRVTALQPVQRLKEWPGWKLIMRKLRKVGIFMSGEETDGDHLLLEALARARVLTQGQRRGARRARRRAHPKRETEIFRNKGSLIVPFYEWSGEGASRRWLQLLSTTNAKKHLWAVAGLTRRKIQRLQQPALAIYGQYSHCLPSCRALAESLPNCVTIIVPGAGHFHPMGAPGVFAQHLRQFLLDQTNEEANRKKEVESNGKPQIHAMASTAI